MSGRLALRAAVVVVAAVSVACAPRVSAPREPRPVSDELLLRVDTHGGFLPAGFALTHIPQFSLYADGLIVMEGAQIAIYPGPAISPVYSMRVNEEGLRRIIEAARRAGLGGPDRTYELPIVADAGTTTFTFVDGGVRHVISAHALGMEDPSIPEIERKARAALLDLQTRLGNVSGWLPEGSRTAEQRFEFSRLAVVVSTEPPGEELEHRELTWPLDRMIAELAAPFSDVQRFSCFSLGGQDLEKLRPLVDRANELTPWQSGGATYWLRFRPLLPDESGCPET